MDELSLQTFIRPVLAYLGLVLLFSIPFWLLDAIYPVQILPGLSLSAFGVVAPSLAALVLTYKNVGPGGVRFLLARALDFNRVDHPAWYFIIIIANPLIAVLAYSYLRFTGNALPSPSPLSWAILPMFVLFFVAALAEEIGWTGYMTEPLVYRWGVERAGIFLGVVWAVWHFIPLIQLSRSWEWIAWWSFGTISLRIIMVWLYTFTGRSVFTAAIFHAMINLCWQLFPVNGSYFDPRVSGIISFALAILLIGVDRWLARRKRFLFSNTGIP